MAELKLVDASTESEIDSFDLEPFKAKYGDVVAVQTIKGVAVFRCPTDSETARYMTALLDQKTRASAGKALVLMTVVHPERVVFGEWLAAKTGITLTCLNPVLELSGVDTEATVKK